jgi:O-antigen/teichoic acid export membrane protein
LTVFLSPLWPAYAEALARGDRLWALKTLRQSIFMATSVAAAGALVFVLVARPFVNLLSSGKVEPSQGLVLGLSCWIVLGSAGAALAMFLNAAHVVGLQVVCSILMAGANIVLSVVLAQRFGVAGVIWGTVIAYTAFIVLPYAVLLPRYVRNI